VSYRITREQALSWRDEYWVVSTDTVHAATVLGRFVACRYCLDWVPPRGDQRTRGRCKYDDSRRGRNGRCTFFNPGDMTLELLVKETAEADEKEVPKDCCN
jgi:hypothetical protein